MLPTLDSMPADSLPKYENPPIAETVMGAAFHAVPEWNVTHYGLFYDRIRTRYPKIEAQPALAEDPDELAQPSPTQGLKFEFLQGAPDSRCWFIDSSDSRLLQIQSDRFLRNWRKRDGAGQYPHYTENRAEFQRDWSSFLEFRKDNGLAAPEVRQCEITYVNLLEQEVGWKMPGELQEVFAFWGKPGRPGGLLATPDAAVFKLAFRLPDGAGRLHVALQNVIRTTDGRDMLQLTLTARGRPKGVTLTDLLKWFDVGHEWIVRGFDELTTEKMHALWKKKGTS